MVQTLCRTAYLVVLNYLKLQKKYQVITSQASESLPEVQSLRRSFNSLVAACSLHNLGGLAPTEPRKVGLSQTNQRRYQPIRPSDSSS